MSPQTLQIIKKSLLATIVVANQKMEDARKESKWESFKQHANDLAEAEMALKKVNEIKPDLKNQVLKIGDRVEFIDLPKEIAGQKNPLIGKKGVVLNVQPNDIDVKVEGYGDVGFLPENLVKIQ